jgi:glycosyltransferase 2 family protein
VSPDRRRLWTLLQVGLTVAALVVVSRLVHLHDQVRVERAIPSIPVLPRRPNPDFAREVLREGGRIVAVVWLDGEREAVESAQVVTPGFLSILDRVDKPLYGAMLAALFVPFVVLALRWWLLLRGHGFPVAFGRVFLVNYAGIFFNHLLPGGIGGDLTKAVLAASGEDRKAAVVATVLLDRLIGLAVLVLLGAVCMTPFAGRLDVRLVGAVYGLAGAAVVSYLLYFSPFVRNRLGPRLPMAGLRTQLDAVFRSAKERPKLMAASAALSLVSQVVSILIIYGMARALGFDRTPLWMFFVFEPIIFIVNALPISVGGWGVQEGVYALLFGLTGGMGSNEAVALSILYKVGVLLVSVPGGLLFAMGAARK